MAGRLKDKTALITGAGSGIGAATARLFAAEGARLAVADLNEATALRAARQVSSNGGEAVAVWADVSRGADVERLVASAREALGRIDVLVNCAGVTPRYAPPDFDYEQAWDWVMGVNLKGTYLVSRAVVQVMKQTGGGSIVNLSSIYGLVGRPSYFGTGDDPYPPSKGGVVTLSRDMANAFAKDRIRVNALCPGFIYTPLTKSVTENAEWMERMEAMIPLSRLGQPDEVAKAALFLASDDASYVTGATLSVDGGYTSQ